MGEYLKTLWKHRSTLIIITTPVVLLLLFLAFSSEHIREASCAYVICLMAVFWIFEVVPLAVTSLLPLVLYPLLGVVPASKVSVEYLKDVNVLFLGGLTVAVAIEHWNLHKRIALRVLCWVGAKPRWLLFGFMITTAFLSMWISNVATTAMMVPIAQAVLDELDVQTNDDNEYETTSNDKRDSRVGAGYLASAVANRDSRLAEQIGSVKAAQALGDLLAHDRTSVQAEKQKESVAATGYRKLPADDDGIYIEVDEKSLPTKQVLKPHSPESVKEVSTVQELWMDSFAEDLPRKIRKEGLAKALTICVCYASNIGGTATLTGTGPNLIVAGQFKTSFPDAPEIDFGSYFIFAFPGMVIFLFLCWLWLQYIFLNTSFKDLVPGFGKKKRELSSEEKRMNEIIKHQYQQLGHMSYAEKSVLVLFVLLALFWLTRNPGFIRGWGSLSIFKKKYVSDATIAMGIAFLLFVLPSRKPSCFCCDTKDIRDPAPALLSWSVVQHKMAWNVILLLGGSFAMALGAKESGLSDLIGEGLKPLQVLTPFLANLVCCVVISATTQCTSNTATATVFLPILGELAKVLRLNPLLLMLPATLVTSYAFLLPVSTPPNAISYSYNHLAMWDMIKAGFILNIVGIGVALASVYTMGSFAFSLFDPCPTWINSIQCGTILSNTTTTPNP